MEIVKLLVIDVELAFHHKKFLLESVNEAQKEKALKQLANFEEEQHLLAEQFEGICQQINNIYK